MILDQLPLHLDVKEVKVDVCVQVHKRINGCSPGYVIVLLVFNSDINNRKTEIAPLTWSVFTLSVKLKGGGGGVYFWCKDDKIVEYCSAKFFN